ncbi:nuclear protein 96-domain-containing protein [Cyathus striatus]|nr:nuclear protein 96-domain-containing protein [Cyathus striatus]
MTRFRAYTSESSSEEEDTRIQHPISSRKHVASRIEHHEDVEIEDAVSTDEGSSNSSSSGMDDDELLASTARRRSRPSKSRDRNALIENEDDQIHYAHEVRVHVSPPSSPESTAPRGVRHADGDPTIIPWAQRVGVDPQKMHVMQASLFRLPEEAAVLKALNEPKKSPLSARANLRAPLQALNRKHSRDSDGDGLRFESQERASFGHDIQPPLHKPSRKYARVEISSSVVNHNEGAYVDAGLAMGRSFRVGWGPGGTLAHLGTICGSHATPPSSANSSIVTISKPLIHNVTAIGTSSSASTQSAASALSTKLLQHHLSHTVIIKDDAGIPFADPSPSSLNLRTPEPVENVALNFTSYASLFPTTDTSSIASLFRLGSALFDPINTHLVDEKQRRSAVPNTITPAIRNRVVLLRRKIALSQWLKDVAKPSIETDLRIKANGTAPNSTYTPADAAFTYLTGHQVEQACNAACDGGYLNLATLISQVGGDKIFKEDIRSQLAIWKSEKLGPGTAQGINNQGLVGRGLWRVYSLLAGVLSAEDDNLTDVGQDVCTGLDWKRVLGLCLWYNQNMDASIADIVRAYESLLLRNSIKSVAKPVPTWALERKKGLQIPDLPAQVAQDASYSLIKLHADPALSLSHALDPLSFAPSGMDWGIGMCWHLYVILSRVMRVRDFADRGDPQAKSKRKKFPNGTLVNGVSGSEKGSDREHDQEDEVDGHSPTADLLTSGYAFELENWGMIQEAAFVTLHVEGSAGREKAIKDLLIRSAPRLDEWMTRGIVGSLRVPISWVEEAKAIHAFSQGDLYSAYELYLAAGQYNSAHDIAVLDLAPDAIIRRDLKVLKSLFETFDSPGKIDKIDGWFVRGKIFLECVEILTNVPKLQEEIAREQQKGTIIEGPHKMQELDSLTKRVPKIVGILPDILYRRRMTDVRHAAALEEMVKDLLAVVKKSKPILLTQIQQPMLTMVDATTKMDLVRGTGYARFLQGIGA